jgi:hypothetical protein
MCYICRRHTDDLKNKTFNGRNILTTKGLSEQLGLILNLDKTKYQ